MSDSAVDTLLAIFWKSACKKETSAITVSRLGSSVLFKSDIATMMALSEGSPSSGVVASDPLDAGDCFCTAYLSILLDCVGAWPFGLILISALRETRCTLPPQGALSPQRRVFLPHIPVVVASPHLHHPAAGLSPTSLHWSGPQSPLAFLLAGAYRLVLSPPDPSLCHCLTPPSSSAPAWLLSRWPPLPQSAQARQPIGFTEGPDLLRTPSLSPRGPGLGRHSCVQSLPLVPGPLVCRLAYTLLSLPPVVSMGSGFQARSLSWVWPPEICNLHSAGFPHLLGHFSSCLSSAAAPVRPREPLAFLQSLPSRPRAGLLDPPDRESGHQSRAPSSISGSDPGVLHHLFNGRALIPAPSRVGSHMRPATGDGSLPFQSPGLDQPRSPWS
ncbi:hypothetical protein NDU88_001576 [Pleurodeles waltl]|uniref:Uncharacterized protein n=1 Tax=Pleurodeles waltl TaxID=8319 RepID=A0AAV7V8Q3_PLEWA|nr:hypothetical protein NDU88_001576 [Pleurodeles waltl]